MTKMRLRLRWTRESLLMVKNWKKEVEIWTRTMWMKKKRNTGDFKLGFSLAALFDFGRWKQSEISMRRVLHPSCSILVLLHHEPESHFLLGTHQRH
ncbi:uncharacterized protein LOC131637224 isoform X1 [Vicia villosa]|uniref:uncharacterized protein LOC131637224 isoform X1 n=1 Tax=Vicia villosa TaxID=3911 RepID=UPI00273C0828|nr:uncharacterized protein LOC131637224 isoform X1 [Vicia villosa]